MSVGKSVLHKSVLLNGLAISIGRGAPETVPFPGRRSFGGFNNVVEGQYLEYLDDILWEGEGRRRTKRPHADVSDDVMIERLQGLVSLPRGPNQGKAKGGGSRSGGDFGRDRSREGSREGSNNKNDKDRNRNKNNRQKDDGGKNNRQKDDGGKNKNNNKNKNKRNI